MGAIIEAAGLRKRFGRVEALTDLELTVHPGEVHGFLGPNGAGKSTTIRILLGLIRASGGTARLFGQDPWRGAARLHDRVAYVPGDVALWPNLTGGEIIDLIARLRGADARARTFADRRERLLHAFQLDPRRRARTYSKGNRQKVALVAAFAEPAELYVLDEPTSGLDPVMEAVFSDEIRRVTREGSTVLLSSHILSEVEALCSHVSIVRAGRTVQSGTLAELRRLTRTEVSFAALDAEEQTLRALPGAHDLMITGGRVSFAVDSSDVPFVLPALARLDVRSLVIAPPSLEELFLRYYGDRTESTARSTADSAGGTA